MSINEHSETLPNGMLISRKGAAEWLGLKRKTLNCWNASGKHDEYFKKIKIGGRVYYRTEDVLRFQNDQIAAACPDWV